MIVESSDQVPRATLLKRFSIPKNFGVEPVSRIERGKTLPRPVGAVGVEMLEIFCDNTPGDDGESRHRLRFFSKGLRFFVFVHEEGHGPRRAPMISKTLELV